MTVSFLLVLAAFFTAIVSAVNKCPLWVSVILICIYLLLQQIPK